MATDHDRKIAVCDRKGASGPLTVPHEEQQTQLRMKGTVVVFRLSRRTTGKTWWRESYTGSKEGDVVVEELREVYSASTSALRHYLPRSGFRSVYAWQRAIQEQMGELKPGLLYEVELVDIEELQEVDDYSRGRHGYGVESLEGDDGA